MTWYGDRTTAVYDLDGQHGTTALFALSSAPIYSSKRADLDGHGLLVL
jgi:hypothetical protein